MKRFFFSLAMLAPLAAEPLSQHDRDYAMSALHASRKALMDAVAGLSEAQAKFKAGPEKWSIFEIAEHLAKTETMLMGFHQGVMKSPAAPEKRELVKGKDEAILKGVVNRDQKVQAPPQLVPQSAYPSLAAAVSALQTERMKTIHYVETTDAAMRDHFIDNFPATGGPADAYQVLLMIAGHTDRHVAQIKEVKAAAGYPAK